MEQVVVQVSNHQHNNNDNNNSYIAALLAKLSNENNTDAASLASIVNANKANDVNSQLSTQSVVELFSSLDAKERLTVEHNLQTINQDGFSKQLQIVCPLVTNALQYLHSTLNHPTIAKTLTQEQLSSLKTAFAVLDNARNVLNDIAPPPAQLGSKEQDQQQQSLGDSPTNPEVMFTGNTLLPSPSPNLDGMDAVSAAAFIDLWLITNNGMISQIMDGINSHLQDLATSSNQINSTTNLMTDIVSWAANNPTSTVNLFYAFADWISTAYPGGVGLPANVTLGTIGADPDPTADEAFAASVMSNGLGKAMLTALANCDDDLEAQGLPLITVYSLAAGDENVYDQGATNSINSPQQLFMRYFVQPTNAATLNINGITSNPPFGDPWTTVNPSSLTTTDLWAQPGGVGNYCMEFTATNIGTNIGNTAGGGGSGVLGILQDATTAVGSSNSAAMARQSTVGNSYQITGNNISTLIGYDHLGNL